MTTRWVLLPLLVYLALDFGSPWVPGAFCFDPDQSVEGLKEYAAAKRRAPEAVASRLVIRGAPVRQVSVTRAEVDEPSLAEWLVDLRRSHRPSPDPSPPSDDH